MIQVDESDPVGEVEPSFPYRDVTIRRNVDVNELYDLQTEIGRGKFGTVYRCQERSSGLQLAAKLVPTPRREDRRNVEREVDIMRSLQHPRLIQLYDAYDNGKMMCVVLELIEGGELFERVISDDFMLTEKSCTIFMRQICEGIEFVHHQNILHLDMKPENILCLTKIGNRIKIIDFGLARRFDPEKKLQVLFGTPEFVAPEVVNFDQIGFGTDMWSVGVICYVLLSGLSPFMGETDIETMANVTIAKYDFDDEAFADISEDAKDFIRQLLVKDRDRRMTASQCLTHPWLRRKPLPPPSEELDTTKDNLRFFVERWSEHPTSPYLFDTSCHVISPCPTLASVLRSAPSQQSLRGLSPSPCGSLSSSPDSVIEHDVALGRSPDDSHFHHYTFDSGTPPKYHLERLQTFERRASEGTCLMRKQIDTAVRVNLADEIRKLSDKLYQMATIHIPTPTVTVNNSCSFQSMISRTTTNCTTLTSTSCSSSSFSSTAASEEGARRPKFRMTDMHRDVHRAVAPTANPLVSFSGSASPCSSRTSSDTLPSSTCSASPPCSPSPEPTSPGDVTKNLLLHLLNKWEVPPAAPSGGCRKASVSLEWTEEEALGQRTISSLNTYFQSSRPASDKTRPVIPP